jgi:hypothetical protein
MTTPQLKALFAVLRANGVAEFSDGKVSVKFASELPPPVVTVAKPVKRPPSLSAGDRAEGQRVLRELGVHEGQLAEVVEPFRGAG